MTNILVVWSLGGVQFCMSGNLFRIFALQNQEASVPIPYSNMEARAQSLAKRPSNHRHTPWPGSPYRWPILSVIDSDSWEVHLQMRLSLACCFHLLPFLCALEKEMAPHSSVLAWRSPGMGEPGGLPSMGLHRVGHEWSNLAAAAALLFGRWQVLHSQGQAYALE